MIVVGSHRFIRIAARQAGDDEQHFLCFQSHLPAVIERGLGKSRIAAFGRQWLDTAKAMVRHQPFRHLPLH